MLSTKAVTLFLFLGLIVSKSQAALMGTPEPALDPLAMPQLVVLSAGRPWTRNRIPERILTDGSHVCPKRYPKGFSIRCDSADKVRKARFFVDDTFLRTEYREPYYIAGNRKIVVKAWKQRMGTVRVTCKLGRKAEVSAKITIGC